MIDTYFMDPEDVDRLCGKSKLIWGSKWRWKKEANKRNRSVEEIEEILDNIINRVREQYAGRSTNKQLGNDAGPSVGDGGDEEEVSITGDGGDNSPVRVGGPIDGTDRSIPSGGDIQVTDGERSSVQQTSRKKVRSGKTKNGTTTTSGTE